MYDYGRNTPGVRLNIERSADVLDFRKADSIILPKPAPETWEGWRKYWVGECPFFVVYRLEVDPCASLETDQTSFHHLLFYRGSGEIRWEGGSFPIKQGDSVMAVSYTHLDVYKRQILPYIGKIGNRLEIFFSN